VSLHIHSSSRSGNPHHKHLPRVLPLVGCRAKTPTSGSSAAAGGDAIGPLATAAAVVSGRLNDLANAGFEAQQCLETVDSAVDDEFIFTLVACTRCDRVRDWRFGDVQTDGSGAATAG
jgi:hypothetical protein